MSHAVMETYSVTLDSKGNYSEEDFAFDEKTLQFSPVKKQLEVIKQLNATEIIKEIDVNIVKIRDTKSYFGKFSFGK
jgi:hypothetical protein